MEEVRIWKEDGIVEPPCPPEEEVGEGMLVPIDHHHPLHRCLCMVGRYYLPTYAHSAQPYSLSTYPPTYLPLGTFSFIDLAGSERGADTRTSDILPTYPPIYLPIHLHLQAPSPSST